MNFVLILHKGRLYNTASSYFFFHKIHVSLDRFDLLEFFTEKPEIFAVFFFPLGNSNKQERDGERYRERARVREREYVCERTENIWSLRMNDCWSEELPRQV